MTSNKSQAIASATMPRDARIPSDFNALLSLTPMEHTFLAFRNGQARLNEIKADYISSLIKSAIQAA
jgi:hypothetical protein